ncbi:MAG: hypothetical protein Terrestrivirus8_49 [Terrestrivirus sp.]|uniref:Uncharacterized protein n=1 Tax=Terrestrivirus sp. TaxID=2487775 RepID=A0A3G4ZNU7_9VIRU|nr:MAG: hypothetical protein Terrestrivirus8_49 [Terrestrivirus sp.]
MEFYIELLVYNPTPNPKIAGYGYDQIVTGKGKMTESKNFEICEFVQLSIYLRIYKLKTKNQHIFKFDEDDNRYEFIDNNIFPLIWKGATNHQKNMTLIALFGINKQFTIHYKCDGNHTMEKNMFMMNYDVPNDETSLDNYKIMNHDKFLILNKNLPLETRSKIKKLLITEFNNNPIDDYVNGKYHRGRVSVLKLGDKHISFGCIYEQCNWNFAYKGAYWLNLKNVVNDACNGLEIESKIKHINESDEDPKFNLDILYSNINCVQISKYNNYILIPILLADKNEQQPNKNLKLSEIEQLKVENEILRNDLNNYKSKYEELLQIFDSLSIKMQTHMNQFTPSAVKS